MEAHGHFGGRLGARRGKPNLSNRRSALLIAVVSAVAAGILIYLFVSHSQKTTTTVQLAPTEVTVFVARHYIPAGMPQEAVAAENLLKPVHVPTSQAIVGAITDPSEIAGEVTSAPIAAAQQVTASDFIHSAPSIATVITGGWRAVAISLDTWHGLTAYLHRGDTVNIMGGKGAASELLFQNISVLANSGGDVVLRLTDKEALMLDTDLGNNIEIWLTLRPASNAKNTLPTGFVVRS